MSSRVSAPTPTVTVRTSSPTRTATARPTVRKSTATPATPVKAVSAPRPSSPTRVSAPRPSQTEEPRSSEKLDNLLMLVEKESIEEKLQNKGFVVTEKILIPDSNGVDVVRYMKARTMAGDIVLIDPGMDDGYAQQSGSEIRMNVELAKIDREDVIAKAYDCAKSITCGVALDCENGLCVLNEPADAPTPGLPPNRTVLTTVKGVDTVSIGMYSVPYPVVLLSQIMSDHKAVINNAHRVVLELRKNRKAVHDPIIERLKEISDQIDDTIEDFANLREEAHQVIESRVAALETARHEYDRMDAAGELDSEDVEANISNRAKYTEVLIGLKHRHDVLEQLERQTVEMASLQSVLADIHARVKAVTERTKEIVAKKRE